MAIKIYWAQQKQKTADPNDCCCWLISKPIPIWLGFICKKKEEEKNEERNKVISVNRTCSYKTNYIKEILHQNCDKSNDCAALQENEKREKLWRMRKNRKWFTTKAHSTEHWTKHEMNEFGFLCPGFLRYKEGRHFYCLLLAKIAIYYSISNFLRFCYEIKILFYICALRTVGWRC